ncbi:uncharacterized protein PRCAT00001788001 [Priceomyces carsonii]|uniref:uncharacterized protein n=1 Tax=Priceomyces carsonii TaxID=28549 RepID=UPI002ED96DEA|nr:unnamed protein product [Priceomyces carsonii]
MDSDDGMLLNFSVSDKSVSKPLSNKNVKVTGGRWKDRRKLQLSLQGRGRQKKKDKEASGVNSIPVKPSLTERVPGSSNNSESKRGFEGPDSSSKRRHKEVRGEFGGKNNTYVSSLFTSNGPISSLLPTSQKEGDSLGPSNAPLKDSSSFLGLGLNEKLSNHLKEVLRFTTPTKIQSTVIPKILSDKCDLILQAQTGSGKTLSIALPIIHRLMQVEKHPITRTSGLLAIILTPTRELATQIYGVLESLTRCCHQIVPGIVIGGEKKKSEKARIRKGVNILVATPGRLADHLENTKTLDVSQLRWLVLDEGDRLVELGFEETITKITDIITEKSLIRETRHSWESLPNKRINILCSATMQNVEKLGNMVLNDPEVVSAEKNDGSSNGLDLHQAPDQLIQNIVVVPPKLRLVTLVAELKILSSSSLVRKQKSMIFFSCSDSVDFHFSVFTRGGSTLGKDFGKDEKVGKENAKELVTMRTAPVIAHNVAFYKLHGSLSQKERIDTLQGFIQSRFEHSILLCTDVASRGLDLPHISTVIEYDAPFAIEDHLHRIGRSARAGNEGSALLFLLPGPEEEYVDKKVKSVHPHSANINIISYSELLKNGFGSLEVTKDDSKKNAPRRHEGDWDTHATTWHLDVERWLLEDHEAHSQSVQAFTSHIRAYATHLSSERAFFNVKRLHFGHLAKSFGLRDTPKALGKFVTKKDSDNTQALKKESAKSKMLKMAKLALKSSSNEFNY